MFNVHLTEEAAFELFEHQRNILRKLGDHPYIAKAYLEILPNKKDHIAMELGVCSVQDLQIVRKLAEVRYMTRIEIWHQILGPHAKPSPNSMPFDNPQNPMPATFVKCFAASRFLGLAHIHSKDVIYCDIMPYNMLIMPEFTLKAIDIGEIRPEANLARDARHLVCNLYYLLTGDGEAYWKPKDWLKERLGGSLAREEFPLYFGMMLEYLGHYSAERALQHRFWTSEEAGPAVTLADRPLTSIVHDMYGLAKAAWSALPEHAQSWLLERGILPPC